MSGACATTEAQFAPNPETPEFAQPFNRPPDALPGAEPKPAFGTYNPAASTVFPDYRLNIGDVLEVIYHVRTDVTAEKYRLKVQDVVSIRFPFQPSLDQDVTVLSDGTMRLLLVGEVPVVFRGQRGRSPFHYWQEASDQSWRRFDPASQEWERYRYVLLRTLDGGWVKRDAQTGVETPLEDDVPRDAADRPKYACLVDSIGPGGRRDRFEYDPVQQRWKTRPAIVEQKGSTAGELQEIDRKSVV